LAFSGAARGGDGWLPASGPLNHGYVVGQSLQAGGGVLPILPPRLLEAGAAGSRTISLARGQRLYGAGDPPGVYLVQQGQLALLMRPTAETESPWCTRCAGELCGEISVLLGRQVDEACALEPTLVTPLDTPAFLRIVEQSPGAAFALAQLLARDAAAAATRLAELAVHPLTERLLVILRRLVLETSVADSRGYLLPDWLTCERLARMAGATREAVSRARSTLAASGKIEVRGRRIILLHKPECRQRV